VKPQSIVSEGTAKKGDKCGKMTVAGKALNVSGMQENKNRVYILHLGLQK
jgi:hypothetical protein